MDKKINIKAFLEKKDADNRVKPWVRWYSRIGFSAKGSVYILIGLISMMTAVGIGEKNGQRGAIAAVASKPFGTIIIWLVVLGLTGYITWLITQVLLKPDYKGGKIKSFFLRAGYFFSAAFYVGLGIKFAIIAINSGQTGSSGSFKMEEIIDTPFGRLAIGITGISIFVFAVIQIIYGIKGAFIKPLNTHQMNNRGWTIMKLAGKVGFVSRGVTFGVLGGFIIHSAWIAEPSQITGIDGALAQISQEPFGKILLGIVSCGLFLYGVFEVVEGKNRYIQVKND